MPASKPSIVITGAALATSLGTTREQTWQAILAGRCGMGPLTAMEQPLPEGKDGGQAVDLPAEFAAELPREARYLKWTIQEAMREASLAPSPLRGPGVASPRISMVIGTTLHGMRAAGEFLRSGNYDPLRNFPAGAAIKLAAKGLPIGGAALTICSACSSSLGAVALGVTLLQSGQADVVIAGGYDTISEYAYAGFNSLRLVAEGPLRPFSKNRQGMKLAEGYGIVILERAADAERRGAKPIAQVLGWGESADAHHLTQPHPQGDGAARAMTAALDRAGLTPTDIDLVAAHATGTPDNDAGEAAALTRVFGDQLANLHVVGFKSHLGHTLGGAGAVELVLSAMALRDQLAPSCANVTADDLEFPQLQVGVGPAKPKKIRATLNTSLGFGGANTCLVLSPPDPSAIRDPQSAMQDVFITGLGVMAPGIVGVDQLLERIAHPAGIATLVGKIPDTALEGLLNARRVRRLSDYVKLQLAAATLAVRHAGIAEGDLAAFPAILGTMHGSAGYSYQYYGQIVKEGIVGANPMLFAEGVPNAGAAHISLMLGLKGACQSVIGTRTAGLDALALASARIASGEWDRAIIGAGEEDSDVVRAAYQHCRMAAQYEPGIPFENEAGFITAAGSAAIVLESRAAVEARGGKPLARVDASGFARGEDRDLAKTVTEALRAAGPTKFVINSANGTWLDRAEAVGMLRAKVHDSVTMATHVAECFSAGPLIGIAAALAGRSLPGKSEAVDEVTALCTDPTGVATAVRIHIL
jgi:3-oxoacyl-[acyl-carrier-protein] synthase II